MPIVGYAFVSQRNGFGCVRHWLELNWMRLSLALCGTFTAAESIRDGRQQQQQLLYVWATIRVMCRHFWNNRFSYQWDWCRNSLDWWCARAAFEKKRFKTEVVDSQSVRSVLWFYDLDIRDKWIDWLWIFCVVDQSIFSWKSYRKKLCWFFQDKKRSFGICVKIRRKTIVHFFWFPINPLTEWMLNIFQE